MPFPVEQRERQTERPALAEVCLYLGQRNQNILSGSARLDHWVISDPCFRVQGGLKLGGAHLVYQLLPQAYHVRLKPPGLEYV